MRDEGGYRCQDIATRLGRSKSHIVKRVKLLKLPAITQQLIVFKALGVDTALLFSASGDQAELVAPAWQITRKEGLNAKEAARRLLLGLGGAVGVDETKGVRDSAAEGSIPVPAEPAPAGSSLGDPSAPTEELVLPEPVSAAADHESEKIPPSLEVLQHRAAVTASSSKPVPSLGAATSPSRASDDPDHARAAAARDKSCQELGRPVPPRSQ
ncbi:hypothetical protein ACWEJ6_43335 [Nonomuraea sp. NPDC004702]